MVDSAFPSAPMNKDFLNTLEVLLSRTRTLWGPRRDVHGVCRLLPLDEGLWPDQAEMTFLPLKKLLLPAREELWKFQAGYFSPTPITENFAVVGVPLCDLQAVWYLDQVFANDEVYQSRRAKSFLVGMSCIPVNDCHCDGKLMPLAGDLLINQELVWALSSKGLALLKECDSLNFQDRSLPWPQNQSIKRHEISESHFFSSLEEDIWSEEAQRCLSCGACSAVCPTCYCFDMLDYTHLADSVTRNRVWDNCFFAEHGKIAGGHDFRPGRTSRLCFRMEHKHIGFGTLRGQNSCVGCGRCRKACPVDIDLDQIAARLGA